MTKTQMLIIMLPPVLTIIAVVVGVLINDFRLGQIDGQILLSRHRSNPPDIRSRMDERFDEMRGMVRDDLSQFVDSIDSRLKRLSER
jgi:hypothetical protein